MFHKLKIEKVKKKEESLQSVPFDDIPNGTFFQCDSHTVSFLKVDGGAVDLLNYQFNPTADMDTHISNFRSFPATLTVEE